MYHILHKYAIQHFSLLFPNRNNLFGWSQVFQWVFATGIGIKGLTVIDH